MSQLRGFHIIKSCNNFHLADVCSWLLFLTCSIPITVATQSVSQMALLSTCCRFVMSKIDLWNIFFQTQVARDRGIMMEKLVTYMRQLVVLGNERGGHCVPEEGRLSSSEVEAVVGRLSKVRVQAARFRSRCTRRICQRIPSFYPVCVTQVFHTAAVPGGISHKIHQPVCLVIARVILFVTFWNTLHLVIKAPIICGFLKICCWQKKVWCWKRRRWLLVCIGGGAVTGALVPRARQCGTWAQHSQQAAVWREHCRVRTYLFSVQWRSVVPRTEQHLKEVNSLKASELSLIVYGKSKPG